MEQHSQNRDHSEALSYSYAPSEIRRANSIEHSEISNPLRDRNMNIQNNYSENFTNFTVKSRVTDSAGKDNVLLSKKSISSHGTLSGNSHRELASKNKDLFMRNSSAE